jgi:outer membrane protein assembly factor BamB
MKGFKLFRPPVLLLILGLVVPLSGCGGGGKSIWQEMRAGTATPGSPGAIVAATQGDDYAPSAAMFRGNPAHTGEYPGPGPKGKLTLLWRSQTGRYPTLPMVAQGAVYVASNDGYLRALDAKTGTSLWRFDTGLDVSPFASSAVGKGVVYVVTEDGFSALDAANGEPIWQRRLDCHCENEPVVADDIAYASGDVLYALDAATGDVIWRFEPGSYHSPAVADGAVYAVTDGTVYALDAKTGTTLWQATVGWTPWSSPSVVGGVLYVCGGAYGSDGAVYALDAHNGDVLWQANTGCESELAVVDGVVYAGTNLTLTRGYMYALDAKTGRVIWQSEGYAYPVVADGALLYVAGRNFHVVDAATGEELWRFPLDVAIDGSPIPVVVDGVVYLGTSEGYVYAIAGDQS